MARKKKTVTPEEINNEAVEAVAKEVVEKLEEVTEEVAEETAEKAEAADKVVEEAAEAVTDEVIPEESEAIEDVKDEPSAEATEVVEETQTEDEVTEEVAVVVEEVAEDAVSEAETEEESKSPAEFMNIEHFADYRSKEETITAGGDEAVEISENAEDATIEESIPAEGETTDAAEGDGINEEEFHEYENLTILDEIEDEESPLPPDVHNAAKDEEAYDAKKPRSVDARFDIVEMFVCMMVAIMLLSAFVFRHSVVDGDSMMNTLHDDEHLIISNFFYEPKQYDIIVCEDYSTGLKKPIIKRVIATEGQTVRVVSMDEVYVDGVLVDTSFVLVDGEEELIYASKYPIECVVPEGEVFVMGDHRNNSLDSRMLGTIDEDTILGKVVLRFYPFDRFGKVE